MLVFCLIGIFSSCAQSGKMDFEKYNPVSNLVVPEHKLTKAKFPFIDVHNHQWDMGNQDLKTLVTDMDKLNMAGNGEPEWRQWQRAEKDDRQCKKTLSKQRFIVFANIDFAGIGEAGWTEKAVQQLEEDVRHGANGLKIFKDLGLYVKDNKGARVTVDDPRLDAIWEKAGELKIPVLIHTADPKPFWDPVDEKNERWLELTTHPGRRRGPNNPAPWETLIEEQHRMFKKHPATTFIAAHFGWYPNDLNKAGHFAGCHAQCKC